jgi:hypothetical protein
MQAKKMRRWSIAITRGTGVEELALAAMGDHWLGADEAEMQVFLRGAVHRSPELDGKLRVIPVIVDVREMTEEEGDAFRKSLSQQEYGPEPPPESL